LKIGIDIDGVLNDRYAFLIEYGTKFCSELGKYKLENVNAQNSTEMFLWSEDIAHEFWDKYGIEHLDYEPVRKFASEVIKKLKAYGNEIYIITARVNNDEWFPKSVRGQAQELTVNWLKKNKIVYDEIYFDAKDKAKVCQEIGIEIMIEDDPKNIEKLTDVTNVFIFDTPYNRMEKYQDITRVYSWYDVYNVINTRNITE